MTDSRSLTPMDITEIDEPQRHAVRELLDKLAQAEAVLASLKAAKAACEDQLHSANKPDALKQVRGVSAIESSIASTRRMIEMLRERLAEFRADVVHAVAPHVSPHQPAAFTALPA